jgi:DNA-directed RNA polymerase II subunit RPB2
MGKQAVGLYAGNIGARMDVVSHVLDYPAPPLVTTWVDDILGTDRLPCGGTVTVAVMCLTGFNQEDSLIASQGAIDRGMFRSTLFRTYRAEERTNGSEIERFERPDTDTCLVLKSGNYDTVNANGLVEPGQRLGNGDCIMGITMNMSEMGQDGKRSVKRDRSVFMRTHEQETVDAVLEAQTPDGHKYVKVKTRCTRIPHTGDKFSSRHGQKGVIGLILPDADMPFTREGITPDLIVNCHALPSRMTLGHLVECLAGKLAAYQGVRSDGTPFRDVTVDKIGEALHDLGLERTGNEFMTSGTTGELLEGEIFIGPTFYQRLKHMVADKRHARARGPYQITTRQPVEGRAREGGLRFGEMERDTLLSHGAAFFALDRLVEQSDSYVAPVCRKCGMLAEHACLSRALVHRAREAYCRNCDSNDVAMVPMPYCFKLLLQEMSVMGVSTSMKLAVK